MPLIKKMLADLKDDVTEGFLEIDWEATSPCQREATARLGKTIQLEQEAFLSQNPKDDVTEGFLEIDWEATSPCQREATARLGKTIQLEQEAFLSQNPKIKHMLETYYGNIVTSGKSRQSLKDAATKIIQLCDDIDRRDQNTQDKPMFTYEDQYLVSDLKSIYRKHYPTSPWKITPEILPTPNTLSSSFISILTSATTLPTPEPIRTPELTMSDQMMQVVSNTVDKAIYSQVTEAALRYDTAYVEIAKRVEEAMEIPVIEIRADIAELLFCAYNLFELDIMEKERIAAEIAWDKRMRKKLKRTLRRQNNFKGYETPPSPKSEISSHPSYKIPPPRPCVCHPQFHYNRYPKDRFGIYLPREEEFSKDSVTVPVVCVEEEGEGEVAEGTDTKKE